YFSPPLHLQPDAPDTSLVIAVADTSSRQPIEVESRHVVVSQPEKDGNRRVLELVILTNNGERTRVGADSTQPTWASPMPAEINGYEVGTGDVSPDALVTRNDSVFLLAPVSPGTKQLVFSYLIGSRGKVEWPRLPATGDFNVLVEEFTSRVTGGTL